MKAKKYMTIEEIREYMLNHDGEMPISFDPSLKLKNKSDRRYTNVLIPGGDSSLIVKVKKGSRILFGNSFGEVGANSNKNRSKILTLFKK